MTHHHVSLPSSLDHARIATLPQSAFYIPNFISEEEEQKILSKVRASARWLGPTPLTIFRLPLRRDHGGNSSLIDDCKPGPPTS